MGGDEHKFDFPSLILDHKSRSKKTVTLVDLDLDIYGLDEIRKSKLPICAVVSPLSRIAVARRSARSSQQPTSSLGSGQRTMANGRSSRTDDVTRRR